MDSFFFICSWSREILLIRRDLRSAIAVDKVEVELVGVVVSLGFGTGGAVEGSAASEEIFMEEFSDSFEDFVGFFSWPWPVELLRYLLGIMATIGWESGACS